MKVMILNLKDALNVRPLICPVTPVKISNAESVTEEQMFVL